MAQSGYVNGKPDIGYWLGEVRRGIAYRKKYAKQSEWDRWRRYYRGEWPLNTLSVNIYFRMLRTVVPRVYFRNPSISITNTRPGAEFEALSTIIERIDNKLIRTMKVKQSVKSVVQHAWMFGTGAALTGYGGVNQYIPGDFSTSLPMHGKERVEYSETVRDDMPWLLPMHPGSFIVPAGLDNFANARWFAQWIKRPLYDVMTDPRLKNTKNLKPSSSHDSFKLPSGVDAMVNSDMIDLVVIRDKKFRKVFVIAPYATDKELLFADDDLQINGRMGCYPLIFNEDDEVFWGVPDSIIIDPQQREINEIRTLQMRHRRLSIVKAFVKTGTMSPSEIEKMTDEEVLSVIQVDGEMSDFKFADVAQEPAGLRMAGMEVMNDVRENLGFSRNQSGNFDSGMGGGSSRATATEASIVQAASEIRIDERRDMTADLIADAFTDINTVIFDEWKDEQVVGLLGPNGLPIWVAVKPEALKGVEYIMNIDPDSALPETKATRSQKAVQVYTMLKANPLIDPEKITKYILRELHGVEFDELMRGIGAMRQGAGGNPDQPMDMSQYIQSQGQPPQQ